MKKWILLILLIGFIHFYIISWYNSKDYIFAVYGKDSFKILPITPERFQKIQAIEDKGYKGRLGLGGAYIMLNSMIKSRSDDENREEREILKKSKERFRLF